MLRPLHIVVDVDGVLRDFIGTLQRVAADHGVEQVEEITSYDLSTAFSVGKGIYNLAFNVWAEEIFTHAYMYPKAAKFMKHLNSLPNVKVTIATLQPYHNVKYTVKWLSDHAIFYDALLFVNSQSDFREKILPCDVVIDDAPHVINLYKKFQPSTLRLMPLRPWNKFVEGVVHFENFDDALTLIELELRKLTGGHPNEDV